MPAAQEDTLMATTDMPVEINPETRPATKPTAPEPEYRLTFFDTPATPVSLLRQILAILREPKITVPQKYYRGEADLPATDMRPWYRDLPGQLRYAFQKPRDPIGAFNYVQERKRAVLGLGLAVLAGVGGWFALRERGVILGVIAGYAIGYLAGLLAFKKRPYPPDVFRDYQLQAGSWLNSVLVHAVGLTIILLPFIMSRLATPAKALTKVEIVDISPYLAELEAAGKKAGGGGGGGDRSPLPASKGAVPKFSKTQLAPPMAVIPNPNPILPVQPSLLGPPELKLPQMAANMPWGDPQGVLGPASNGPGTGGGIGTGTGTGIGSGNGAGLGPGDFAGVGGGPFSVGGSVTAPIPIYRPEPAYSEEARKAKYQGTVVLWIVVDVQGNVTDARVVKPLGMGLDEKALETVRTWKFKPGMRGGVAVPVRVAVEVSFRLF
jgi:TonB family protein